MSGRVLQSKTMTAVLSATIACILLMATTLVAHADDMTDETLAIASEIGIEPLDLQGALNTTGLDARTYLCQVGEGPCPQPPSLREYAYQRHPDVAWCIERIVNVESNGWYTRGWNPVGVGRYREHASGLGGFLPSTWATTPQGRAGASIWDGYAQVDAIAWMLHVGRGREFAAVSWGRCR